MAIISKMDTQHNIGYLPFESNHVMSTNGKVSLLLIIMSITVPLAPTAGVLFTTNTILLQILSLFKNCQSLRPLSQNIFNNFSDSHLQLKSTTFKKTLNIRSSKHRINFALLPVITSRISHICTCILKSRRFGKCYLVVYKKIISKTPFYPGVHLAQLFSLDR